MSNPNFTNCILGSGIAGLTVFYYLAESTKTRNLVITNSLESQTSAAFPLGPRFLHQNKDTEALLRRLRLSTKTKEVFIGYKTGKEIRNFPDDVFKTQYSIWSRGISKSEDSFLTGGKSSFTAYEVSQNVLAKSLLKKCLDVSNKLDSNNIVIADIKNVSHKKITTSKSDYYADNVISTIPLNALTKILSNSSMTVKISTVPEIVYFFLVDENERGQFDYIYSITDTWYRKTYIPEMKKWVYEARTEDALSNHPNEYKVLDKVRIATQISKSLNLKELGNIKLVGRYGQMNHSIKTEDVIRWAHNYTRKFNEKKK